MKALGYIASPPYKNHSTNSHGRQASFVGHPFKRTIHSFNVEGNENHPYRTRYLADKDAVHYTFKPTDNPNIDTKDKVKEVIKLYPPGSLRDQKIFNKWVVSEGRVFNKLNVIRNLEGLIIKEIGIGADYGSVNPTTFVPHALCFDTIERRWKIVRLGVYYHDPRHKRRKADNCVLCRTIQIIHNVSTR